MTTLTDKATEALAEAWASIDGNYEAFARERAGTVKHGDLRYQGRYDGYMAEASEMRRRLTARGYDIVALAPEGAPS